MGIFKPTYGSRLKLDHPLAKGLVGCWVMNEKGGSKLYNLGALGKHSVAFGDPEFIADGIAFDGGDDYFESSFDFPEYEAISIVLCVRPHETADGGWCAIDTAASGDDIYTGIRWDAPGRAACTFNHSSILPQKLNSTDSSIAQNTFQSIAFIANTTPYLACYINGKLNTTTIAGSQAGGTSTGRFYIGAGIKGPSYADIKYVYFYNRNITPSEVQALYSNPYAMFEDPYPIELFGDVAADEGWTWGEQNPTPETAVEWSAWKVKESASDARDSGDWGELQLGSGEEFVSDVKDRGTTDIQYLSLSYDDYAVGSGSGTLYWRGQTTVFNYDDDEVAGPTWAVYAPGNKNWRYIQVMCVG